jgi:hypothetical protein
VDTARASPFCRCASRFVIAAPIGHGHARPSYKESPVL